MSIKEKKIERRINEYRKDIEDERMSGKVEE